MYEVAPFTAQVDLALLHPPAARGQPGTPQLYARRHAYPSVSEYDITTAVNGDAWSPKARRAPLRAPRAGTPRRAPPLPPCTPSGRGRERAPAFRTPRQVSLHLPKSGTWYVCVHAPQLAAATPVAVSVAAQAHPLKPLLPRAAAAARPRPRSLAAKPRPRAAGSPAHGVRVADHRRQRRLRRQARHPVHTPPPPSLPY